MTETESTKVYELAKELGIDSISLLDKLKNLNIKVKNHMSELADADLVAARNALKKAAEAAPAEKKAAVPKVRKKVAAPDTTNGLTTATKTVTKTATTRKAVAAVSAPVEKKSASPIIRRRTKADGATETYTQGMPAPVAPAPVEAEETESVIEVQTTTKTEEVKAEPPAPAVAVTRHAIIKKNILTVVDAPVAPPKPAIKPAVKAAPGTPAAKPGTGTATETKDGFRVFRMNKESIDQMVEEEAAKKRGARSEVDIRPEDVRFADYRKKEMVFLPKKKKIPIGKELRKTQITLPSAQKRVVEMQEMITVQELANQLHIKTGDVLKKLMSMGQMATINQALDFDTASLVATEYQFEVKNVAFNEAAVLGTTEDSAEELKPRPPVVTIMGHVDHGKTTLLDSIRSAKVAEGEAGGITQHIGAYTVVSNGKPITFLDTPGHEAFSMMRARGANLTDIVVLVVSADDGVMPQTREAASHAQAAKVPIIVAVNKIDKPGANPEKVKQGLSEINLLAEDWGGDTMFVPVSALKKTNLDKLLEAILLQAEVLDVKANPIGPAGGTVLEARLEKGRGPVVNVLVSRGTLKVGDAILSGIHMGRVKALMNDKGQMLKDVGPGMPVEVLGFEGVPNAGDKFNVATEETDARKIISHRLDLQRLKNTAAQPKVSLEDLFAKTQTGGETKELKVIVKADVFGSVEALKHSLEKLSTPKVKTTVIHAAPGGITETDVHLAKASNAIIIGFGVRPETKARQLAESEQVEVITGNIIYEVIDTIKNAMTGLLDKKKVETFLGRAEVRQVFSIPKFGTIAGSSVIDGKILRGANVRLLRDSKIIFEGKMSSLKRFKDDAKEVATGFECGIGIENYNDVKTGDIIEAYQIEYHAPTSLDS